MSKIEDVKKAFEVLIRDAKEVNASLKLPCIKRFIGMFEVYGNQIETLQSAINALTEPEKVDLSDLRVGDEVEDYQWGWGEVKVKDGQTFTATFQNGFDCLYWQDGKQLTSDLRPSIIAVRRKPRTVEKEVHGYLIFWLDGRIEYSPTDSPYNDGSWNIKHIVPISGEYEEEAE